MISKIQDIKYYFKNKKNLRIAIISGEKSFKKIKGKNFIEKILPKNNNLTFFFKKNSFPEIKELKKIIIHLQKFKPQLVIAIGGGSVLDYAKLAVLDDLKTDLNSKIKNGKYDLKKKLSRLIAIPTTAGSGAEVTSSAVIYINNIKYSVEGESLKPENFFLIPELILNNSNKIKSSSGFDAISQAVESIISVKSNKQSLLYAKKSLNISLSNYKNFLNTPSFINCSNMSLAAMYSGKAINISRTTAPHALSYPFTAIWGISHGHAVSLTLEKFLKFNFQNQKNNVANFNLNDRYKIIFNLFKVDNIIDLEKKIKNLKKSASLEDNFQKLSINIKNDYHKILDGVNSQRLKNNPIKINKHDLKKILLNN